MNHIEAMKQMVDALEATMSTHGFREHIEEAKVKAIAAGRQAIAEAEKQVSYSGNGTAGRENMTAPTGFFFQMPKAEKQEPVACPYCKNWATLGAVYYDQNCAGCVKRMTHPQPKREPLTDEQIEGIFESVIDGTNQDFARAIEAAHGIKE